MSNAAPLSEHRWEGISARDNARLHNGHVYNIHNHAPGTTNPTATLDQAESSWRKHLRGWLSFIEINDRGTKVSTAHEETFRWIFMNGNETGFAEWLSSGKGVFWINGKPASGKSTLIKFIANEEGRLKELLNTWSGEAPLVIASFYFWIAGSHLQRSLVGLYRSLLLQILKADEHLYRVAFPEWQQKFSGTEPTIEMLTAAMDNILANGRLAKNFFFIIDGLDEYETDSLGKTQLAEMMLNLTKSSRVKLLVSSRPETPFKIGLRRCPTIRLEQLTRPDIESYVKNTLWSNPFVRSISDAEKQNIDEIARFVLKNAQGVFLWVVLTIKITLNEINNCEDVSVVRDRVMCLPPELDEVFTHILTHRIPRRHRQEAFRCLLIALAWQPGSISQFEPRDLSYVIVSVAHRASTYAEACSLAESAFSESPEYFMDRLANRCQGLLEVGGKEDDSKWVTFLHRTLLDYLHEERRVQLVLEAEKGETFDVYTAIMAGLICARGKYKRKGIKENSAWKFFYFNKLAESSTGQSRAELIAIFDRLESSYLTPHVNGRHWSADLLKSMHSAESNLLLWAACCGASRYIQEAIENGQVTGTHESTLLLYYALTPIFSPHDMCGEWPAGPNIELSALLLDYGADPTYEIRQGCLWAMMLNYVVDSMPTKSPITQDEVDITSIALSFLLLFARRAPDLRKCSAIRVTDGFGVGGKEFTVSTALRKLILERTCCRNLSVQTCQCQKALALTPMAIEVLRLTESPRNNPSRTRRMLDVTRSLLSSRRGRG